MCLATGASVGLGCRQAAGQKSTKEPVAKYVRVVTVAYRPLREERSYDGITRGASRAELSFVTGGRLKRRAARVGARVKAGQVLASLDGSAFDNRRRSASALLSELAARITQLQRDSARVRALRQRGAAAAEEQEKVLTALRAARAQRNALRVQLDEAHRLQREAILVAPFDGIISATHAEPGDTVARGRVIVELVGKRAEIPLQLAAETALRLRVGQSAEVDLPLIGRHGLRGRIRHLASSGAVWSGYLSSS